MSSIKSLSRRHARRGMRFHMKRLLNQFARDRVLQRAWKQFAGMFTA